MTHWNRLTRIGVTALLCSAPLAAANTQLDGLFGEAWEFRLREAPLFATSVGRHEYNDRLPSMKPADLERRAEYWRDVLGRLAAIDRAALSNEERINYDIFERQARDRVAAFDFKSHLIPITAETGFHTDFARLPDDVPLATVADYENYLARLGAFPDYVAEHVELMRRGMAESYVLPKEVLDGYPETISVHLVDDAESSVFAVPFASFPSTLLQGEQTRLRQAGHRVILEQVVPAYQRFFEFMTGEYIPNARSTLGASELPNGREYYAHLIRHFTTLDVSAEEVHRIGLGEVARIRAEMDEIIARVGFEGGFAAFLEHLRTNPRFYAKTPEELLKEASFIAKRMDGKLPALFRTLPRLPYGVEPVPAHIAPKYTAGRYVGAPVGSTKPGYYWVNTYALESRPLYALTALSLHEAVPGHHLQNALRQELEGLPNFRRFSGIGAYGEGWGLYSEWLGIEAGMYEDPYDEFGRLTYEMWRACRLVVDTGIHAMDWKRQQVIDYLASNTALSLHEVTTETDRYISWPGQALSYKMGELTIRRLRREAEAALGERFDVRDFHEVVLMNGPVPMTVLEDQVRRYVEETRFAGG